MTDSPKVTGPQTPIFHEQTEPAADADAGSSLDVVFKYAHHGSLLPELSGLLLLRSVCEEIGFTNYVGSPQSSRGGGWSPATPSHHELVTPTHTVTGKPITEEGEDISGRGKQDSTSSMGAAIVSTDLSSLAAAFENAQEPSHRTPPAQDIPSRTIVSREGVRPQPPRKPPTPDALSSRRQLSAAERSSGSGAQAPLTTIPSVTGAERKPRELTGDYEYHSHSTQGAALSSVFLLAMREQAQAKVQRAKQFPSTSLAVLESMEEGLPFQGLRLLHETCVDVKNSEPYRLVRFTATTWNNALTQHQKEKLVMNATAKRSGGFGNDSFFIIEEEMLREKMSLPPVSTRNGSPGPASKSSSPKNADQQGHDAAEVQFPHPPGQSGSHKRQRLNTADRIRRKTEQLKASLDILKTTMDVRYHQQKQEVGITGLGSVRSRRLKAFLATLPTPKYKVEREQKQAAKEKGEKSSGEGSGSTVLPSIGSKVGSGVGEGGADKMRGGVESTAIGVNKGTFNLPSIRPPQTAGTGNNMGMSGSRLNGTMSHASELLRSLTGSQRGGTQSARGAPSAPGAEASGTAAPNLPQPPRFAFDAKPPLKSLKHRFSTGTGMRSGGGMTHPAPASVAVSRKLVM